MSTIQIVGQAVFGLLESPIDSCGGRLWRQAVDRNQPPLHHEELHNGRVATMRSS